MPTTIERPLASECAPYYGQYVDQAEKAIGAHGHPSLIELLSSQPDALAALLRANGAADLGHAYAPGKWTLGESLVHVAATERVFSYRLLRDARGDTTPLPGFDQDAWVPLSGAAHRTMDGLLHEIAAVRGSTLSLLGTLDETALVRVGTASGHPVSARAIAWIIAGHFAHHLGLTRDRYLAGSVHS